MVKVNNDNDLVMVTIQTLVDTPCRYGERAAQPGERTNLALDSCSLVSVSSGLVSLAHPVYH